MHQSTNWYNVWQSFVALAVLPVSTSLRIGVILTPPSSTSCSLDVDCQDRGYAVTAAMQICDHLNLNCTFHWFDGPYGDVDDSGKGTGIVGAIQRGEFDMTFPDLTPTYRRSRGIAFSKILFYSKFILITRATQAERGKLDLRLFNVFQWPVMLGFFLALVIIAILLTISTSMDQQRARLSRRDYLLRNGATLVSKRYDESILLSISNRLLVSIWGLAAIVLAAAYTGILFSTKIIDNSDVPFTDLDSFVDCVESQKCRLVMPSTQINGYFILSEILGETLAENPVHVMEEEKILPAILEERSVYLVWFWEREGVIYDAGQLNIDICQFYSVETTYSDEEGFAVPKGSPLLDRLNMMALGYRENGVADALIERYYTQLKTCGDKGFEADLGIYSMLTIFYLYILGIMFSVVAFLVEGFRTWIRLCRPSTNANRIFTVRSRE